jgi:C_GCAxxG_C_C family probable redox protein
MNEQDLAVERFKQKYSCSQAVFSVFAERHGIPADTAFRIAAGFGGGIARTAQTCGCVTGAVMALGLAQRSVTAEENPVEREKTYAAARELMEVFASRHGSTRCLDLLGCDIGTPEGREYANRNELFRTRCVHFIRDAVELAAATRT